MRLIKKRKETIIFFVAFLILIFTQTIESSNRRYYGREFDNTATQTENPKFFGLLSILYNIYSVSSSGISHIWTLDGLCLFFIPTVISVASSMQRSIQTSGSKKTVLKSILNGFTVFLILLVISFVGLLVRNPYVLGPYAGVIITLYSMLAFMAVSCLLLTLTDVYRVNPTGKNKETIDNIRGGCYMMHIVLLLLAYSGCIFGGPAIIHAVIYSNLVLLSSIFYYCGECFENESSKMKKHSFLYRHGRSIVRICGIAVFYYLSIYLNENCTVLQNLTKS